MPLAQQFYADLPVKKFIFSELLNIFLNVGLELLLQHLHRVLLQLAGLLGVVDAGQRRPRRRRGRRFLRRHF